MSPPKTRPKTETGAITAPHSPPPATELPPRPHETLSTTSWNTSATSKPIPIPGSTNNNKVKPSRIPVPVPRARSPDRPRPDSPTLPKTGLLMGTGGERLGFDPRTGAALDGNKGSSAGEIGSESGSESLSDEEGDAREMETMNSAAIEELNRLEELIRLSERRTIDE